MSHFSKIKTSISNIEILRKALNDLGFVYKLNNIKYDNFNYTTNTSNNDFINSLVVFDSNNLDVSVPLCIFCKSSKEYNLIVDISLWSLNISVDHFLEKLHQRYALNMILDKSISAGFYKKEELVTSTGSFKLTIQKWIN